MSRGDEQLTLDEIYMGLAMVDCLVAEFKWRAANDVEGRSLVWQCAAEIAGELSDNLKHIADELEDEING